MLQRKQNVGLIESENKQPIFVDTIFGGYVPDFLEVVFVLDNDLITILLVKLSNL